ncbi:MAG: alpha-amylase [Cytophagaceae bacterium]|nr:alpha-amylase [Cytophagaceae bacterium]
MKQAFFILSNYHLKSITEINLELPEGKKFWSAERDWEQEIIYFLLVDRFHDDKKRKTVDTKGNSKGFGTFEELNKNYGGTLKGIKQHLGYIKNLGCTSIWLSPVFENNPESYHGYAIQNFFKIDPRFGANKDLKDLITEAHALGLRVILDVVLNHSGNNWSYKDNNDRYYKDGMRYDFGRWHSEEYPVPVELRDPQLYKRKGMVRNWDKYPETTEGDFFVLKKFNLDESRKGRELQNMLLKIYCYWIKETDCDGFRLDAVKHIGQIPVARFCQGIREYTNAIGKKNFFLFGEIPGGDALCTSFFTPIRVSGESFNGMDSILDFPLHFILAKIIEGKISPEHLLDRYQSKKMYYGDKKSGDIPFINFLDNHDQMESPYKKRLGAYLSNEQIIAAIGILFCLPGIPCLYYGTEQGLQGEGNSDIYVREALFDSKSDVSLLNEQCNLYKEIAVLAEIRSSFRELTHGAIVFPEIFEDSFLEKSMSGIVAFSRKHSESEVFALYNPSNEKKTIYVNTDNAISGAGNTLKSIYTTGKVKRQIPVKSYNGTYFFEVEIAPFQFIILK